MFQEIVVKGSCDMGLRADGEKPDHLLAVWYYAGSCQLNEKIAKTIGLLQGLSGSLKLSVPQSIYSGREWRRSWRN